MKENSPSRNPQDDPIDTWDEEKILSHDIIHIVRQDQAGEDLALHPY